MLKPLRETVTRDRGRPLRVAILCSHRAPGLRHLLENSDGHVLVACLTTEAECTEAEPLDSREIPLLRHDIHEFHATRDARLPDPQTRYEYDRRTLELLDPFGPDVLVLCGYLYIVTAPLIEAFPSRLLNIHHSDLCLTDESGRPRYRGLRSVREAVFAGERETRSTVHVVTEEVDGGPPLIRSWPFPTHPLVRAPACRNAPDILKAYAYAHREWMMRESWGPLLSEALARYARDEVRIRDGQAWIAGRRGPIELARRSPEWLERVPEVVAGV